MGNVGRRLAEALERAGWHVHPVRRDAGWSEAADPADPSPRVVAVREEQLGEVLRRLHAVGRERLVLVPNGFLEAVHGELDAVGRGLIWFAARGDFFESLRPSTFHGPAAEAIAAALAAGGLEAQAIPGREAFVREMILKGLWNSVVGLPLAVHDVDLATYLERFEEEGRGLCEEGMRAAGAAYGVEAPADEAWRRLLDSREPIGWVRTAAKALAWRNGALARFGRQHAVPTPINDRLLQAAGYDPDDPPVAG